MSMGVIYVIGLYALLCNAVWMVSVEYGILFSGAAQ